MGRTDTIALVFVCLGFLLLLLGVNHQVQQQKDKVLCRGHLKHIGTLFFLHQQKFSQQNIAEWNKIFKKMPHAQVLHCPTVPLNVSSYKLNLSVFSKLDTLQQEKVSTKILFFDAADSSSSVSKDLKGVEWRHLGGANFLQVNGAVVHRKKFFH